MLHRFFLFSLQEQQLRKALVCRNKVGPNLQSMVKSRCGVSVAILRGVDAAEIVSRLRSAGSSAQRLVAAVESLPPAGPPLRERRPG